MALNKVELCGVNTAKLPLLKEEEKEALFVRIKAGDEEAREEYIKGNLRLVLSVIKRFSNSNENADDLFQIGCVGLMKAVDRFDPGYGVAFSTYAVPLIIGEIKRFLRGDGAVHISRTIRENAHRVAQAIDEAAAQGGASIDEICRKTGLEKQEAVLAMSAMNPVKSLEEPVAGDGDLLLKDMLGQDQGEALNDRIALGQAMEKLTETEQEVILRRYYKRHTQTQIASDMGMTQVQVSRMEKKILGKLRELLSS